MSRNGATTSSAPADVLHRLVAAFGRGDEAGVLSEFAEDAVIRMPAAPPGADRVLTGHEEIAKLVGYVGTTWKSVHLTRLQTCALEGDANRALAEYALEGVNLDDSVYRNEYVTLATVVDGKVKTFTEYFDPDPIVGALAALRAHLGLPRVEVSR